MSIVSDMRKYRIGVTVFHRRTGDRGVIGSTKLRMPPNHWSPRRPILVARVEWSQPSKLNSSVNWPVSVLLLEHP